MTSKRVVAVPIGWLCPTSNPDGPIAPLSALIDPCGRDCLVWSDGYIGNEHPDELNAVVDALAGVDPEDHGPGCDGPWNCTCGAVQ